MRRVESHHRTVPVDRRLLVSALSMLLATTVGGCGDAPTSPAGESAAVSVPALNVLADGVQCTEPSATLPSGAPYRVCVRPDLWNGHLLVFLPGYRNPAFGPATPDDEIGGISVPAVVTGLGYAWATTGFCCTGLIEPDSWLADALALVATARTLLHQSTGRAVDRVFAAGGSQGGHATVMLVERYPQVFDGGGLAACGPIGDYEAQLRYVGDARVTFDALFRRVINGWPIWQQRLPHDPGYVDPESWTPATQSAVAAAVEARPDLAGYWLGVTGAPIDAADPAATTLQTVSSLLRYSFMGTNDAIAKLNGLAFTNVGRVYSGSGSEKIDRQLNHAKNGVQRFEFTADPARVAKLETTGRIERVVVTMHTIGDEIVPVWQQDLYREKTKRRFLSSLLHNRITIHRYGHCNFTVEEVLGAFALLVLKSTGQNLFASSTHLVAVGLGDDE